jgi:hypothetical protein
LNSPEDPKEVFFINEQGYSCTSAFINSREIMQAILKSKHQRFSDWLQDIKDRQAVNDDQLDELEQEMLKYYEAYQQKREELRKIIFEYEEKQKAIRNRIKRNKVSVLSAMTRS